MDGGNETLMRRDQDPKGVEQELVGLTVGDGFKFGCGFTLAATIGLLAGLVVLTVFMALGIFLGIKLPLLG